MPAGGGAIREDQEVRLGIPIETVLEPVRPGWVSTGRERESQRWPVSWIVTARPAEAGSDFDLDRLVAVCPSCHGQTDAPYSHGHLVITPLGDGRFTVEVTQQANEWEIRDSPPVP